MAGVRIGGSAVVLQPPGPPFAQTEGNTGGGADQANIWTVNAGGTPVRLTPFTDPACISPPCGNAPYSPRLSPDGTLLALFDFDADDSDMSLYVIPSDGTATYPLSAYRIFDDAGGFAANHADWFPTGAKLVFTTASPNGGSYTGGTSGGRIMEVTYPGGALTELWVPDIQSPTQREEGWRPTYSPDGTKIAFFVNISPGGGGTLSRQGLWVMDADGTNVTQLDNWNNTDANGGYMQNGPQLAWSNDSQWIAYVDQGLGGDGTFSLYKIKPDGTSQTLLSTGSAATIAHFLGYGAWADDDSYVLCSKDTGGSYLALVQSDAAGGGDTVIVDDTAGVIGGTGYTWSVRQGSRIYWPRRTSAGGNTLYHSSALDGTDIQTYYDGTTIDAILGSGQGFALT